MKHFLKYFFVWAANFILAIILHKINPNYWRYDLYDVAYFSAFGMWLGFLCEKI